MVIGDSVKFGSGVLALCFDWAIRRGIGNVLSFQPPCMICFRDGVSPGYSHASAFLEYNHWFFVHTHVSRRMTSVELYL